MVPFRFVESDLRCHCGASKSECPVWEVVPRTVTVTWIVSDGNDADYLDRAIEKSQLLNEFAVYLWETNEASPEQIEWFKEYLEEVS